MADHRDYGSPSPFATGLACRCPRCGKGKLFDGFLSVAKICSVCGTDLEKADSGDGPAVFIIFILGALVVPMALLLEARAEPPMWVHMAIWPAVILGGSVGLLRPLKGLMIALQFKHKASDSGSVDYD
ncbi:DUF983 domain-containing protein [Denitrobaculum tricleocarpae]|uniref:DUF983 domain-containing protein n=1 Tax=Denitrobaculum tricleocarpae TaxID=2591009 RepID=A0A545U1Y8_9PROT|nr:DUF983 domain-containing protein [Denitrobaculum tricleocarpae]TQV83466.1 DUF983 domain-containing protein [Denitrobaculum tricleocarpae]